MKHEEIVTASLEQLDERHRVLGKFIENNQEVNVYSSFSDMLIQRERSRDALAERKMIEDVIASRVARMRENSNWPIS